MDTRTASLEVDELIGQPLFGSYVIKRQIGKGGMGAVYAVESAELGKTLAMKVLLGEAAKVSTTTAGRFVAEARAASAINHRNIITILDSAQLPDGRRYILMEYLEGPTLREFSKQMGPLTTDVALAVLAQVCSGLQAAHARGIIHRDLKPSNILINPQPDNPYFTKILDFGIAKLSDPTLGSVETHTSALAGTPSYMSPEQARALKDVDHRTDIYALGVMAYRLFCGKLPYRAHSIGELVHQQTTAQPESLAVKRGDLPAGWVELVHSAMAIDPADRPQSAHEFADRMIAATPQGEAIARGAASLLFATETGSFSNTAPSASWSHVSIPEVTEEVPPPPPEEVPPPTKATVANRPSASMPPMADWVVHNQPSGAHPHSATNHPPAASQHVERPKSPRRVLWLVLWFATLVAASSVIAWLALRDTSGQETEASEPATTEPAIAPNPQKPTPTVVPIIEVEDAMPPDGDTVAETPEKKNSETTSETSNDSKQTSDRPPRKPAEKSDPRPKRSNAKDEKPSPKPEPRSKSDEEDLFNLRK